MKIQLNKDLRCLKKDSTFEFKEGSLNIIVGGNGSGKTTLLDAVRGYYEPPTSNDWDLPRYDRKVLSRAISVEGGEDIAWFGLSKKDDPTAALDAYTFLENGGMALKNMSEGEKFFAMFLNTAAAALAKAKAGEKAGLILDEVDCHFDFRSQVRYIKALSKIANTYNITILMSSHHLGVIIGCTCLELRDSAFYSITGIDYFDKLRNSL